MTTIEHERQQHAEIAVGCVASATRNTDNRRRCPDLHQTRTVNDLSSDNTVVERTANDNAGFLAASARAVSPRAMPASTLDPVSAAICTSLAKAEKNGGGLDTQLAGATRKALLADVEFEPAGSYQNVVLDKLKTKYVVLKGSEPSPQQPRWVCDTSENR